MPEYRCKIRKPSGGFKVIYLSVGSTWEAREILEGRGYEILDVAPAPNATARTFRTLALWGIVAVVGSVAAMGYLYGDIPASMLNFHLPARLHMPAAAPRAEHTLEIKATLVGSGRDSAISLMVSFPGRSEPRERTNLRADGAGRLRVRMPLPPGPAPTTCSVTLGARGYQPVVLSDRGVAGHPPSCDLGRLRLRPVGRPTIPSPTVTPGPPSTVKRHSATASSAAPSPVQQETSSAAGSKPPSPNPKQKTTPPGWQKARLKVIPGRGVGHLLELGQPVPRAVTRLLGPAEDVHKQALLWGEGTTTEVTRGVLVTRDATGAVSSIRLRGLHAITDKGVYLGAPARLLQKRYPGVEFEARPEIGVFDGFIPGLVLRVVHDKIVSMTVEPLSLRAWRFMTIKVVPGRGAGPIVLGQPLSAQAVAKLGEPDLRRPAKQAVPDSGVVRWGSPGPRAAELIELTLGSSHSPRAITSIRLRGVHAVTGRGLAMGASAAAVHQAYPEAKEGLDEVFDGQTWKVAGMSLLLVRGRLTEIRLY